MLYIRYGKLYLHKQRIFSRHSISFKKPPFNQLKTTNLSAKFDSHLFTTFTHVHTSLNFLCTEQYKWFTFFSKFLRITDKAYFLCISSYSNKHFVHSYENNTDTVTSRASLQINLSIVCSQINDNLQCRPQWVTNLVHLKY